MKPLIRLFFRTLRIVLGPFMLLWEVLSRQKPVVRPSAQQAQVDQDCRSLVLYHFKTCPFCIKVRKEMHRLALPVEKRDAQHDAKNKADLLQGSGRDQVPCLKVTGADGQVQWIKDSGTIISYLNQRFGTPA
ncbi:glutathione S-transferase N-terminal domain-containing protein [Rhodoferax sp.]|uniref:glutaredoxin family protein n=1 Tax=Rhodoferax sp. TaxID=50421 RepID=UPI00284722FC|nr:glutathione S-transferase N-terminal domain-containing protein [Rhodoferax sp.]MDR3369831.1 glutathione S-transferase N-terminal domain-containing protein [Rhodoferax sp.]